MISSGALPNVAFRKPPIPGPVWTAACSVASPISHASGIRAIAEMDELGRLREVRRVWNASGTGATQALRTGFFAPRRAHPTAWPAAFALLPEDGALVKSCGGMHRRNTIRDDRVERKWTPSPGTGRGRMPPLRGPLREGGLPRRLPPHGLPFVYAYEAWGRTYMGCIQKVFDVEIDLFAARGGGVRARRLRRRPRSPPAAPDVRGRRRLDLRQPRGRPRLPEPRVLRAPPPPRELSRLRSRQRRVLAPCAERNRERGSDRGAELGGRLRRRPRR